MILGVSPLRELYTALFYILTPLLLLRLYWRGINAPQYRRRWRERFAIYQQKYRHNVIWIHAVSVGEAEAVFPLIKQLQSQHKSAHFLVTTTTPTGSARVQSVLGNTVEHVYLPYDLPIVIKRFLTVFKPKIALFVEKEIWPNFYLQCANNLIPCMIINARLSANSAKKYQKIPSLIRPSLTNVAWVLAQTTADKQYFIDIGAHKKCVTVVGNLKFDLTVNTHLIQQALAIKQSLFRGRFVWIIASTHAHEETIFLSLYVQLKKQIPQLLLLLVPRHPERFERVKKLAQKASLTVCMRSTKQQCDLTTDVYIADTMGELKLLYGTADICFVGGSMVAVGGHNILEPIAMKVPILFGRHMINFKEIAQNILHAEAAIQCTNKDEIINAVLSLYNDCEYRMRLVAKANDFVIKNQGATHKTIKIIQPFLMDTKRPSHNP